MTSTTSVSSTVERETVEKTIHKLKLQWIMAKSDEERSRISEEIRERIGLGKTS